MAHDYWMVQFHVAKVLNLTRREAEAWLSETGLWKIETTSWGRKIIATDKGRAITPGLLGPYGDTLIKAMNIKKEAS